MTTITVTLAGPADAEQNWSKYLVGEIRYHLQNDTLDIEDCEVTYTIATVVA